MRAVKQKVCNEAENRDWEWGEKLKILSPHTPYRSVRLALRARKTLTPRFTDFFTDFEEKSNCFAVYIQWVKIFTNSQYSQTPLIRKLKGP